MTDHPPPPDPRERWSGSLEAPPPSGSSVAEQFALLADRVVNWVNGRRWWITGLLWLIGFIVLLPLLIVARTRGSRGGLVGAGVVFVLLLAVGATDTAAEVEPVDEVAAEEASPSPEPSPSVELSPSPQPSSSPGASPSPESSPSPSPSPSPVPTTPADPRGDDAPIVLAGRVTNVVDGDTIDLADGTRVRLAITDTPEVHGGFETCGPEASAFTSEFVSGEEVAVYRPVGAPAEGDFGRAIGEVVRTSDGASLNVALVTAGLGTVDERFTSEDPDLAQRLRNAAASADAPRCESQEEQGAPPPPPSSSSGQHTGRTDGGWECHPAYRECLPIGGDLDCADVGHSVVLLGNDDPYRLDGNNTTRTDGVGCESYPSWSSASSYPYY